MFGFLVQANYVDSNNWYAIYALCLPWASFASFVHQERQLSANEETQKEIERLRDDVKAKEEELQKTKEVHQRGAAVGRWVTGDDFMRCFTFSHLSPCFCLALSSFSVWTWLEMVELEGVKMCHYINTYF